MRSDTVERGGKAVFGATVGILMLEARFPRVPGDMGNALSWPFPVHYRVVRGASPDRVVRRGQGLLRDRQHSDPLPLRQQRLDGRDLHER